VLPFAVADATKIWGEGDAMTIDDTGDDVLHDVVVTVAAVQRMRMTHDPCSSWSYRLICAHEVGFKHDSVECL